MVVLFMTFVAEKVIVDEKKRNWDFQLSMIINVFLNRRGTLRDLSSTTTISATTLHLIFKEGSHFKLDSSTVAPLLTGDNKTARLRYFLNHLDTNGLFDAMTMKYTLTKNGFTLRK